MSGEKTEEATDKKKEDTRKKGQVAVSKDAVTLFKILFFYLTFFAIIDDLGQRMEADIENLIQTSFSGEVNVSDISQLAMSLFIAIVLPLVGVCVLTCLVSTWAQIGFVIAPEAVLPSFKKFDAVQNIKGMFSKKSLVQLLLSVVKVIVLGVVAWLLIIEYSTEIVMSYRGDINGLVDLLLYLIKIMVYASLGVFIVLSAVDWFTVFADHKKNIMMSKNEVKDEQKQAYGDPQLKHKRKSMHRNLVNSSLQKVGQSKVVVANPTHISVALDYEPGKHDIPFIVAMGVDEDALLIRQQANLHGIPIIRSVGFARQLYAECEEDEYIKEQHLRMAAEVFKLVLSMSAKAAEQQPPKI
jgi:type III secretion protein U